MTTGNAVHVAVGVVRDGDGNILITKRLAHAHQGGLWEFPGGKLEAEETVFQALRRELREEVGIEICNATPLIKIHHRYPDLRVLLDVWQVKQFSGEATACEGQAMHWVAPHRLSEYAFPAANRPIINAARLPDRYAILEGDSTAQVLDNLSKIIQNKISLLQLRIKSLPATEIDVVYQAVLSACQHKNIRLLINSDLPISETTADGIHLSSQALMARRSRPAHHDWVAASCHNQRELHHAENIGVDFVVLAPILATPTHPGAAPLGWERMMDLVEQAKLPVFALGGLRLEDMEKVIHAGGQGVAGISAFL